MFRRISDPWVTVRVVPDKELRNYSLPVFTRALADLYKPFLRRVSYKNRTIYYQPPDKAFFDILFTPEQTSFYFTVPAAWAAYLVGKLKTIWEHAAIDVVDAGDLRQFEPKMTTACDVKLMRHNIFSIHTEKDDNAPLSSMLAVIKDIREGERVRVSLCVAPVDRKAWQDQAQDVYRQYKKGVMPRRMRLDRGALLEALMRVAEWVVRELIETFQMFVMDEKEELARIEDPQARDMEAKGGPAPPTVRKLTAPTFKTWLSVLSQSDEKQRAEVNMRTVANAYRDLTLDNELDIVELSEKAQQQRVKVVITYGNRRDLDTNIMSAEEIAKLMSLPTAGLQKDYPTIKQIDRREVEVNQLVLDDSGIPLGRVEVKGHGQDVFLPTRNKDELCLPMVAVGGMGSGKTSLAANLGLEAFRKGYSAVVVDPAQGASCDAIRDALTPAELPKLADLDYNNVDYPLSTHWMEVPLYGNRLAAESMGTMLLDFVGTETDDIGTRTRSFFRQAARAIFQDPQNTPLEVALLLTSEEYRAEMIDSLTGIARDAIVNLDRMSNNMRMMIALPILNRLDEILGHSSIKNCLAQRPKMRSDGKPVMDFRRMWDDHSLITIRASDMALGGKDIRNMLLGYVTAKIMLSTFTRDDPNVDYRPTLVIMDEPHQYATNSVRMWERLVAESRKYRVKFVFLFHSWSQLKKESKEFARILQAALPHYLIYSTSEEELQEMKNIIQPWTVEEAMTIPSYHALVRLRAGKSYLEPFMCSMLPPPGMRLPKRDNSPHTLACSKLYGNRWEGVEQDIYQRESIVFRGGTGRQPK